MNGSVLQNIYQINVVHIFTLNSCYKSIIIIYY
jgi:hypothetical protein